MLQYANEDALRTLHRKLTVRLAAVLHPGAACRAGGGTSQQLHGLPNDALLPLLLMMSAGCHICHPAQGPHHQRAAIVVVVAFAGRAARHLHWQQRWYPPPQLHSRPPHCPPRQHSPCSSQQW